MKKFINVLALLALGFTMVANAQTAQTAPPPAAPNILQLDLADGSAIIDQGKLKMVSRQGDVVIIAPAVSSVSLPAAAAAPAAVNNGCGRAPSVLSWAPAPAVAPVHGHTCGQCGGNGGRGDIIGAIGHPVMSVARAPFQIVGGVANVIGGGN